MDVKFQTLWHTWDHCLNFKVTWIRMFCCCFFFSKKCQCFFIEQCQLWTHYKKIDADAGRNNIHWWTLSFFHLWSVLLEWLLTTYFRKLVKFMFSNWTYKKNLVVDNTTTTFWFNSLTNQWANFQSIICRFMSD